jgi:antitoxin VapB
MALHITDPETDRVVRELAQARGVGLTEAIKLAVENELRRLPLADRIKLLQDQVAAAVRANPEPPVTDWKAFYDSLEGDEDAPATPKQKRA